MLPPEINSGRMYAGAGSAPLLTAAAAWDALATELYDTAASYSSVISGLTSDAWSGASAGAMVAAVAPYVAWINSTAAQAEQSAKQARAAASAYEAAFAMTVPPPVVTVNRTLLTTLVATNALGQNTPAIAAMQADYAEMWAQDAAAMYGYAGDSAAAATLAPFASPPRTVSSGGPAAAAAGTGGSAAITSRAALSTVMSATPQALQGLASPLPSTRSTPSTFRPFGVPGAVAPVGAGSGAPFSLPSAGPATSATTPLPIGASTPMPLSSIAKPLATGIAAEGVPAMIEAMLNWLGSGSAVLGSAGSAGMGALEPGSAPDPGGAAVAAGRGGGTTIGALSVPQQWTAGPTARAVAAQSPAIRLNSAPRIDVGRTGDPAAYGMHPAVMACPRAGS